MFAPSRGRELKYVFTRLGDTQADVRPLAGAGIEIVFSIASVGLPLFAPSRGRELKYIVVSKEGGRDRFAPSRGRELKSQLPTHFFLNTRSPPRGGGN